MPAYKDTQKGTWYAAFYYQDWKGIKKKKLKRGFPTKKEALAWERTFLLQQAADLTMTFDAFVEIYILDKQNRLRENTWSTKEHIIRTKILPYFKEKRLCDIKPQDVIAWQNELLNYRGKNGEPYRFNAKQTRNDRRIEGYYEKICSSKQEKPFHEIVLQIGNKDDTGIHTELAETAKQCLIEYANGFQARNPTLRVFWSHLHMDEATPHVHIDFVPYITGSKRSMDTRVSLKQALAQLGFKGGTRSATEWNQWAQSEKQVLAEIMLEHGIEWEQLGTHEEHLSVLDYKKQERAKEVRALDTTIAEKQTQVSEIEQTLQSVQKQVVDLDKIENVSVKKALLSDKVTLPRNDFENLLSAAKQYVVYRRQDESLQGLLDAANAKIKQLEGIIGELKQKISKLVSELSNIEFWHTQELNEVKSESREVRRENLMLKHEQKGLVNLLRRHGIDPAKERIRQQEHDER